jgi:hypothetical protein
VTTPADIAASSSKFLAHRVTERKRWLEAMHARCEKRRFDTERNARNRMHDIHLESDETRVPIRAYKCSSCFGWHLTSWPAPSK